MRAPIGGRATPAPTATVTGHPWPVYGSNHLRAAGRVTVRDGPPFVPWLSGKADNDACGTTNPRGDFNVL